MCPVSRYSTLYCSIIPLSIFECPSSLTDLDDNMDPTTATTATAAIQPPRRRPGLGSAFAGVTRQVGRLHSDPDRIALSFEGTYQ